MADDDGDPEPSGDVELQPLILKATGAYALLVASWGVKMSTSGDVSWTALAILAAVYPVLLAAGAALLAVVDRIRR